MVTLVWIKRPRAGIAGRALSATPPRALRALLAPAGHGVGVGIDPQLHPRHVLRDDHRVRVQIGAGEPAIGERLILLHHLVLAQVPAVVARHLELVREREGPGRRSPATARAATRGDSSAASAGSLKDSTICRSSGAIAANRFCSAVTMI